ncbi:hypothetical protein LPJ64_001732 [Coemansia asiatica]|uniref:Histidinol-phosphatase n=1 Tax=Coemansia asiatica TaxID=1052880 RepID=A0A9W7XKV3_9FUNG|nr:hypothetical protein LPJ64_001732 [Coemansia asiatica]KAJ2885036.1 hypothetical protein FB639_001852 [Coemansia asiatica]
MPFTFHTHSGQFCKHASGDLESVVKKAVSRGMLVLGLSEHVPRSRPQDLYPEEAGMTPSDLSTVFSEYVSEAQRLREKYSGQIEILIGAETEHITRESLEETKQLREKYRLDYVVGSLHHIDGMPLDFSKPLYEEIVEHFGGNRKMVFQRYFEQQFELLQELQPEVIGHFDLVRIFHPYNEGVEDPLATSNEVWQLAVRNIEYAIGYGAIFEINSRAWKKGLRDAYPQRDLLGEILARGGRVTISDDSHGEQDLCMYYDRLLGYLREMGIDRLHYLGIKKKEAGGGVETRVLENATAHEFWSANGF